MTNQKYNNGNKVLNQRVPTSWNGDYSDIIIDKFDYTGFVVVGREMFNTRNRKPKTSEKEIDFN